MLLSLFTGTALGSISTGGVPLIAIAMSMGIPLEPVAGAIVSGACFGDKMSPMSDTTNLAPAICGTDIYSHIRSMMYTTVPATIVVFIMYVFLGFHFTADSAAQSNIPEVLNSLQANFNISLWTLIPPLLVLASAIKKVPALMAMVTVGLISMVLAVVIQHASLNDVMNTAYNGFVAHTGNKQMDAILSKGGVKMMTDLIVLLLFAGAMGGAITASGIMDSILEKGLLKLICNVRRVVFTCMIYCYLISMITGKQPLSLILSGKTFVPFFDRLDIDRKVLSRTTEDAGTLSVAVIPWSGMGILAVSVLGVSIGYIRYTFLPFVVPIFSMICAFTNFGIWHADGTPKWGKNKKKNDQLGLAN
ncbi:MAG: Na+/H+ antiporter NhaC family protein, partial [Dehalobacterium sp.]